MSDIRLAWRNIWRNRRRTLLTAASIFLAIFLALIVRSLQIGWFDNLTKIVVQSYTGHIQIHKKGYWDDRDINNSIVYDDSLTRLVGSTQNVDKTVPRLEYFALSSFGKLTKGVLLAGTDPTWEDALTHLSARVVSGRYLDPAGKGILVAEGLASFLGLHTGDTLVLLGQGFHGVSAAGKYPVSGILHFPSPQLNNQMVYMNLAAAQDFFSADQRITSLSVTLVNPDEINATLAGLKSKTDGNRYEVMRWDEMMIEVMPCDLNSTRSFSSAALSVSLRLAVGSSRISSFTFLASALAISTSCCLPMPRLVISALGDSLRPTLASNSRVRVNASPQSITPSAFAVSLPRKMFSAIESSGTSASS